jgi:hypothetical protein
LCCANTNSFPVETTFLLKVVFLDFEGGFKRCGVGLGKKSAVRIGGLIPFIIYDSLASPLLTPCGSV